MTVQDKLTRGERIRLESLAQAINLSNTTTLRPSAAEVYATALEIEKFLLEATDSQPLVKPGSVVSTSGKTFSPSTPPPRPVR